MDDNNSGSQAGAGSEMERLTALLEQPEVPDSDNERKLREGGRASAAGSPTPSSQRDEAAGPAERPVPGDENGGEGDPAEGPAIAAPRSWPADMREAFAKLPGDLQQVIATRENERDTAFNRQVREAVERRQAAEAELAHASTERRHYLANLNA